MYPGLGAAQQEGRKALWREGQQIFCSLCCREFPYGRPFYSFQVSSAITLIIDSLNSTISSVNTSASSEEKRILLKVLKVSFKDSSHQIIEPAQGTFFPSYDLHTNIQARFTEIQDLWSVKVINLRERMLYLFSLIRLKSSEYKSKRTDNGSY